VIGRYSIVQPEAKRGLTAKPPQYNQWGVNVEATVSPDRSPPFADSVFAGFEDLGMRALRWYHRQGASKQMGDLKRSYDRINKVQQVHVPQMPKSRAFWCLPRKVHSDMLMVESRDRTFSSHESKSPVCKSFYPFDLLSLGDRARRCFQSAYTVTFFIDLQLLLDLSIWRTLRQMGQ